MYELGAKIKKLKIREVVNVNHFNFQILFKVQKMEYIITNCYFILKVCHFI